MDKSELGTVKGQNRNFALSTQNSHKKDYALNKRIIFEEIQLLSGYLSWLLMFLESQTWTGPMQVSFLFLADG